MTEAACRRMEEENIRLKTATNEEEDRLRRMITKVLSPTLNIWEYPFCRSDSTAS